MKQILRPDIPTGEHPSNNDCQNTTFRNRNTTSVSGTKQTTAPPVLFHQSISKTFKRTGQRKSQGLPVFSGLMLILIATILTACQNKEPLVDSSLNRYYEVISGVTSGVVKRSDPILIEFTREIIPVEKIGTEVPSKYFSLSPSVAGKAIWTSTSAIVFTPSQLLDWDKTYVATLELGKITKVPKALKILQFNLITPAKQLTVTHRGLIPSNEGKSYSLKGTVNTSDEFDPKEVGKIFEVLQDRRELKLEWDHQPKLFRHNFEITEIDRKETASEVLIRWNGSRIGLPDGNKSEQVRVPALSEFSVSTVQAVQNPDQMIEIVFSDPVDPGIDLRGAITLNNQSTHKIRVEGNVIKVFPASRLEGTVDLRLTNGILSIAGYPLIGEMNFQPSFGSLAPQVRLIGKGVIVPEGKGLFFPFEATGLSAVDVRITQIFKNNIHAFLQDNDYSGDWRLQNVGRVIKRAKVDLSDRGIPNLNVWNAFNIDLSTLITVEAGAIYNIEIGFRRSYALTTCDADDTIDERYLPVEEEDNDPDRSYESVYYSYYSDWDENDDPCKQAYYAPYRFVNRNILGSNFGIIAKTDQTGNTYGYVTSLLTAKPESGVQVSVYDFQNQLLGQANTNSDGMVKIGTTRSPFMLVAKKDKQIGYLKIDNSTALSLSQFDVSGRTIEKGLKGFFYAERDVWRPGDSIYMNFILDDPHHNLPEGHPLVLEVRNVRGQLARKMVLNRSDQQIYPFYFSTSPDDPTGNWHLTLKIGAIEFSRFVRIETVKPNRLKIDLDFRQALLSASKPNIGTLSARWLHGALAKNLTARVDVTLSPMAPGFSQWTGYDFSTPYGSSQETNLTVFDGPLGEEGSANLKLDFKPNKQVPGFLKARFMTKVFEPGGEFSIQSTSRPFSPYSDYVGLKINWSYKNWNKLNSDEAHTIEVATVDEQGNPVSLNQVQIKLFELDYRWWYHSNSENLASYAGQTYHKPVLTQTISTHNGKGQFTLGAEEGRWGRHLLLVSSPNGHVCGQVIYFGYSWGREKPRSDAQVLALISDKESYKTGEDITISFPANKGARALLTFETSTEIIGQLWLDNLDQFTRYTFKATPEMAPNIYAQVMLIQPHGQTANDLPIRLFGIIPILVEHPGTHLQPEIGLPDELRPLKEFTLKVSEAQHQAMEYTIALVDEGLLDLTNFKTPDPWNYFYAREALGIKTFDLYNYVMGAWGSRLESMFAVGGSDMSPDPSKKKANRFPPVVKVLGPYKLAANRTASHKLVLPQYVGSVRAMVVAAHENQFGQTEKTVPVREPLMVLATLPRVLSPDETVDLPVSVFAMKPSIKQVKVSIKSNDLISVTDQSEKNLTFETTGEKTVLFRIRSAGKPGIAKIKAEVSSGSEKSFHEIELEIRMPNLPHHESELIVLEPGQKLDRLVKPIGYEGTNKARLEVTPFPPLNLGQRLDYLITYPHGCIEQVTSAVFPQVYLPGLTGLDEAGQQKISDNIRAAIDKLSRFQVADGGFSYWPGGTQVHEWGSCYAGHFLIEAEKAGYLVPSNLKKSWLTAMRNEASGFVPNNHHYRAETQIYRLYLLSLAGEPQIAAMNRIKTSTGLSNQNRWMLAGAYALAGMKEVAMELIDFRNMVPDSPNRESFGSVLRDEAFMLQTLLLLEQKEQATTLAIKLAKELSRSTWYSTQSTAVALVSVSQYITKNNSLQKADYRISLNGKNVDIKQHGAIDQFDFIPDAGHDGRLIIENKGKANLFVNLNNEGIKPGVDDSEKQDGLQLSVSYLDKNGQAVNPRSIGQGTDFIARVTITNSTGLAVENLALSQQFPAGWEIINQRLFDVTDSNKEGAFDYRDIRDDRVFTYFNLAAYQSKTFLVHLNSTYSGDYILSPVTCEAMYDRSYFAKSAGYRVTVVSNQ